MKRLTLLLLLFSCLNVWAFEQEYQASTTDTSKGLKVQIDGEIATITLYKSDALSNNLYWPGNVNTISEWDEVKYINLVSEDEAEYSTADWEAVKNLLHKFGESGDLSLDCSGMVINDAIFKLTTQAVGYIKMPNGLVDLAEGAFEACHNLSAIGWSPALKTIGAESFESTSFTSISVPEGVTYIGAGAFSQNPNLTTISLPSTLEGIGEDPLEGCRAVISIHSHSLVAPHAEGDICDNTGWNLRENDFAFYDDCILYIHPDAGTFESYLKSPIWCKFFIAGAAVICLHPEDTHRPMVIGEQTITVNQENVAPEFDLEGFTRTFTVNSLYVRDMSNVKWYTIMLPFGVAAQDVQEVFGPGTQILAYSGIHNNTLCFEEVKTSLDPDVPYLIKPGTTASEYLFDGATVNYTEPTTSEMSTVGGNSSYNQYPSEFVGTYCNKQIPVYAYYLSNNTFYYMPSTNTKKGWKAYGAVVVINAGGNGNVSARPSATYLANIDADAVTGIDSPKSEEIEDQSLEGTMYTLSGQPVTNPGKGIYILNGKKILIK